DDIAAYDMLAADRPIIAALRLPVTYAVTPDLPETALLEHLARLLESSYPLIQLRAPSLGTRFADVASAAIACARERGATLILNGSPALARTLDADGVHLNAARLRELTERPLPANRWVGASCHTADE